MRFFNWLFGRKNKTLYTPWVEFGTGRSVNLPQDVNQYVKFTKRNNMITPEQICSLQFIFLDLCSKEGHDFLVNGLQVEYMDGDKKITQELDVNDEAFFDIAKGIIASITAMINFKNGQ